MAARGYKARNGPTTVWPSSAGCCLSFTNLFGKSPPAPELPNLGSNHAGCVAVSEVAFVSSVSAASASASRCSRAERLPLRESALGGLIPGGLLLLLVAAAAAAASKARAKGKLSSKHAPPRNSLPGTLPEEAMEGDPCTEPAGLREDGIASSIFDEACAEGAPC